MGKHWEDTFLSERIKETSFLKIQLGLLAFESLIGAMFLLLIPLDILSPLVNATLVRNLVFATLFVFFWLFFIMANLSFDALKGIVTYLQKKLKWFWLIFLDFLWGTLVIGYFILLRSCVYNCNDVIFLPWLTIPFLIWAILLVFHINQIGIIFLRKRA